MAEEIAQYDIAQDYREAVDLDGKIGETLEGYAAGEATPEPCAVWLEIRSDVVKITELKIIPKRIRDLIKLVISLVDQLCPR